MKNTTCSSKNMSAKLSVTGVVALFIAGCTIHPHNISDEEKSAIFLKDQTEMFSQQETISHPLTLEEAMARAVKYNLSGRLAVMRKALEKRLLDSKSYELLPSVASSAGWRTRDKLAASSSESLETGTQSLEPSTSQDKKLRNADLSLSWNILDFGIGYFGARIQANNVLAANEQRRAVIADIIQQVRSAYWAAATAQDLEPGVKAILAEAKEALKKARQTEIERLIAPVDAMRYQKSLLKMISQLENLSAELINAKTQLATLMNIAPTTPYTLASIGESGTKLPKVNYSLENLESLAMINRPEINEEVYKARNAVLETRSQLTHLLPGASLFVGTHYDSNSYLVNQNWADAGVQVSWNLMNVFSYSSVKNAGEAKEKVAEIRRQALRMAVLTQVNVAWHQYHQSQNQYKNATELLRLQNGIEAQTRHAYQSSMKSRLEQIRMKTETVLITRHRDQQLAKAQSSLGAIYQAAGLDPLPEQIQNQSIKALTLAIAQKRVRLLNGELSQQQPPLLTKIPPFVTETFLPSVSEKTIPESRTVISESPDYVSTFENLGSLKATIIRDYTTSAKYE
ncbi:TolC family protein [Vibrio salinus]|uniref:TolC family protein n=1 Tax=Vibrio salinus TaxID=2899784 RepID=UPI001E576C92|nr:TolC family protein [Vibrio salinus]MCE0495923.1 TolC family protein [Vibrio salinus]